MHENVVVGFCTNMAPDGPAILCRSVRQHLPSSSTEIVLITNDPARYEAHLKGLDVSYRMTPSDMTRQTKVREKLAKRLAVHAGRLLGGSVIDRAITGGAIARFQDTLMEAWSHPMAARWFGYAAVIRERPAAKRFLLTDTKDVVVQDDCFSIVADGVANIFQESEFFGNSYWNDKWVRDGFGDAAVRQMVGIEAICVGTVLGCREPILRLVDRISKDFIRYPFRTVEQGMINWLLFSEGDPEGVERAPNISGAVTTLSGIAVREQLIGQDGMIRRKSDGAVCPIVHMYDRFEDLKAFVRNRYLADRTQNEELV
nr:hypothetical protein [uncultured Devosia sp.]